MKSRLIAGVLISDDLDYTRVFPRDDYLSSQDLLDMLHEKAQVHQMMPSLLYEAPQDNLIAPYKPSATREKHEWALHGRRYEIKQYKIRKFFRMLQRGDPVPQGQAYFSTEKSYAKAFPLGVKLARTELQQGKPVAAPRWATHIVVTPQEAVKCPNM